MNGTDCLSQRALSQHLAELLKILPHRAIKAARLFTIIDRPLLSFWRCLQNRRLDKVILRPLPLHPALQLTHASYAGRLRGLSRFRKASVAIDIAQKGV